MASVIEFTLNGDQAAARDTVMSATASQGFAAQSTNEWSYLLTRGNNTKTLLLGAMAGKDFYLKFGVDFSVAGDGFIARLSRDVAGSALRGGVIGASKASDVFQQLADAVGAAATQAGIYVANRTVS
ncbi:MAG TPA: hypothetical protein VGM70_05020 [Pseudolysinimonas sp.]|jgi:hypothetical protein